MKKYLFMAISLLALFSCAKEKDPLPRGGHISAHSWTFPNVRWSEWRHDWIEVGSPHTMIAQSNTKTVELFFHDTHGGELRVTETYTENDSAKVGVRSWPFSWSWSKNDKHSATVLVGKEPVTGCLDIRFDTDKVYSAHLGNGDYATLPISLMAGHYLLTKKELVLEEEPDIGWFFR